MIADKPSGTSSHTVFFAWIPLIGSQFILEDSNINLNRFLWACRIRSWKKVSPFPALQSTESLWKKCPKIGPQLSRSKITNVHKFNFHSQGSGLTRTNLLPIEDLTCWSSWFHHWWQQRGAASTLGPQWWIDYCWAYGPYRIQLTEKNRSF